MDEVGRRLVAKKSRPAEGDALTLPRGVRKDCKGSGSGGARRSCQPLCSFVVWVAKFEIGNGVCMVFRILQIGQMSESS